ncbi:hypothetical protein [Demequina sp. NBRC 110052]|uniref:hypothetical protein n=1 Tax=Demequina sp. NBRC 110052 TaxID=1570341 RepID=UPI000A07B49B|nr:hypothetical protein [Demequina sp. NBRC 110052]
MSALAPPAGNPTALDSDVDRITRTRQALETAADLLEAIAVEARSDAVDELRGEMTKGRDGLRSAEDRYDGTVRALRDYTIALHDFHDTAQREISAEHDALLRLSQSEHDVDYAAEQLRFAAMNPDDVAARETWDAELYAARMRHQHAGDAVAAAQSRYAWAEEQRDAAARRAISRIQAATSATDDSLLDHVGNFLTKVGEVISAVAEWAEKYFAPVIQAVAEVVKAIVIAAAAVMTVIALIALVALVATVVFPALFALLAAAIGLVLQIVSALALAGLAAYGAAQILGLDDLATLRLVVLALSIAAPAFGAFLLWRLSTEVRAGATWQAIVDAGGHVAHPLPDDDASSSSTADARERLRDTDSVVDSADDLLRRAGQVDAAGGDREAVVDITRIVVDGEERWIVTLPSTMDWVLGGDAGAPNDLDANLMLMLYPELASQYEVAVLDAMAQAGIDPGEPVVLTGWSLGGIMAGHLASSGAGGYDYAGIVAAGSPIDHMDTHGIPVLQVKHELDPVHQLDLIDIPPTEPGRVEVWDGGRSGIGIEAKVSPDIGVPHANELYAATLQEHLRHDATIDDGFEDFFYGRESQVDHHQYAFSE